MKKRALSFILVLVMILSVFPTSSFALSKTYKGVTVDYGTATYKNQVITYIKERWNVDPERRIDCPGDFGRWWRFW